MCYSILRVLHDYYFIHAYVTLISSQSYYLCYEFGHPVLYSTGRSYVLICFHLILINDI